MKRTLVFLLSMLIGMAPMESRAHVLRLILETNVKDIDSTRFTIDFATMTVDELSLLPEKLGEHADLIPEPEKPITVQAYVPAGLPEKDKAEFAASIQEQMSRRYARMKVQVIPVEINFEPTGVSEKKTLKYWKENFREIFADYKKTLKSDFTKKKDKVIGAIIGVARSTVSVGVWVGNNALSVSTLFQVPASVFLDILFSTYEDEIDTFKATHRLKGESIPVVGHAVQFYNDRPLLKSWVVGNLIGIVAANYFRFWSWVENPERTSAPWSADAMATYASLVGIGNLTGALGAQGPRMLRKKGYIDSRTQYYIYSSYGAIFQLGGFFYGLGWNRAAITVAVGESIAKAGLYSVARLAPNKEPRAIVMHGGLSEQEATEVLYRAGLYDSELKAVTAADFDSIARRLKGETECESQLETGLAKESL